MSKIICCHYIQLYNNYNYDRIVSILDKIFLLLIISLIIIILIIIYNYDLIIEDYKHITIKIKLIISNI